MAFTGLQLALFSAAVLGFRHGFDYDHIAAISDITSVQGSPKRAMQLGFLYGLGDAATVALLGSVVILFQMSLPRSIDRIAERLVGLTLIFLGIYVLGSLFRGDYVPRSRFVIFANALKWLHWQVCIHCHNHEFPNPDTSNWNYEVKLVFCFGVFYG